MTHRERDHAPGTVERGNDWLDGALAGWLLFIAISAGQLAWFSVRDRAGAPAVALDLAAPVLAVAAIFPLLRFHRIGWVLAFLALALMAGREGMMLAEAETGWRSTAAFLVVNVLGILYLLWIIPEFWPPRHAEAATAAPAAAAPAEPAQSAASTELAPRDESPEPAAAVPGEPTPVMRALAAIHHRIVAAGSACAVTEVAIRAEAGRFGVTPASLRTEGLALYRTFLGHFMADGALSPDEERELICLERALDLDDDGVWRLRGEAGLGGGTARIYTAPALTPATAAADDDDRHPPILVPQAEATAPSYEPEAEPELAGTSPADRQIAAADIDETRPMDRQVPEPDIDETRPMDRQAAEPDLSAQADIAGSLPRIHSPGTDAGRSAPDSSGVTTGPGTDAGTSGTDSSSGITEPGTDAGTSGTDSSSGITERGTEAGASGTDSSSGITEPGTDAGTFAPDSSSVTTGPGTDTGTSGTDSSGVTTGPGTDAGTSAPGLFPGTTGTDAGTSAPVPEPDAVPASPIESPEPEAATPAYPFDSPAAAPGALADYEEHELGLLLAWAGIPSLPGGASRRTALERLRALHRTSTEPLDACASDHPLEAGEQCLSIRTVELYRVPPGAPPAAPAPDVPGPVLDPLALVDGSLERERDLTAYQRTGVCRFLLTERRLLLVAPSGQQSPLPLSRVRTVQPFRNGLEVRPQTGHPVFLAFTGGVDDVAMRIDRAARDLHA